MPKGHFLLLDLDDLGVVVISVTAIVVIVPDANANTGAITIPPTASPEMDKQ